MQALKNVCLTIAIGCYDIDSSFALPNLPKYVYLNHKKGKNTQLKVSKFGVFLVSSILPKNELKPFDLKYHSSSFSERH